MKKIVSILGVVVIVVTLFSSVSNIYGSTNTVLTVDPGACAVSFGICNDAYPTSFNKFAKCMHMEATCY